MGRNITMAFFAVTVQRSHNGDTLGKCHLDRANLFLVMCLFASCNVFLSISFQFVYIFFYFKHTQAVVKDWLFQNHK